MPRPKLVRTDKYPYHVTARSNNREWFYVPTGQVWKMMSELLNQLTCEFSLEIHEFVLMSNHFHALITTPGADLDTIMEYFLRETAKAINRETGRINHVFGGPYKWSVIASQRYYEHAYRYVAQNPVKAGIVDKVEEYAYSTISYLHRNTDLNFPITESFFDRQSVMDLAIWQKLDYLNTPCGEEERAKIRRAMKYAVYSYHRKNPDGQASPNLYLEFELTRRSER